MFVGERVGVSLLGIADSVLFVSGEEGSFINGASLVVDGGMSCN